MKTPPGSRCAPLAVALAMLLVPAAQAGCKRLDGSGGTTPSASDGAADADSDDDVDDDDAGGGGSGSGGVHKAHRHGGKHKGHKGKEPAATADGGAGPDAPSAKFAIHKPTPEPLPAPPLRASPSLPPLPVFPARDKYPKEVKPPKPSETASCAQVWTGTEYVAVECVQPTPHEKHPRLAKVVVPYTRLRPSPDQLPKMVDHRANGTEGRVRAQGGSDCTAFAFTAALDHAYARWTGTPADFSIMQVWARYHKGSEAAALASNVGDLLAPESEWPYDKVTANSWQECSKDETKRKGLCGKPVDEEKLKALDKKAIAEITQIEIIQHPEVELLREKLAAGQDATVALNMHSFATAGDAGAKYITGQAIKPGEPLKAHEVLLSGYAMTPNGTYYLVHNSWGQHWGDQGFAWLHEDTLKAAWTHSSIEIPDVEPLLVARRRGRPHGALSDKCEGGKVPDSISGLCAGRCPDGGPRHNNVCADEKRNECPAGHINLTGECVLSAPKATGSDAKIKWECAPSGCTYELAQGELECKAKECQISCPAPDFRLATTSKGFVCVE